MFDDSIYVYHDDLDVDSSTIEVSNVTKLSDFLGGVPASFLINVEIKVYQNNKHHDISKLCSKVMDICDRREDIDFIFSSFCVEVYEWFRENGCLNVMMLADTMDAYQSHCKDKSWVCVDANIIDDIQNLLQQRQRLFIYNIKLDQVADFVKKHDFISGYIFDF
jgi:hypothetical protein